MRNDREIDNIAVILVDYNTRVAYDLICHSDCLRCIHFVWFNMPYWLS